MMLLVLFYYSESSSNIKNVIERHISVGKYHNDPIRNNDSAEFLVEREKNDPNYSPTQNEIMTALSICKYIREFDSTLLNGGLQRIYLTKVNSNNNEHSFK